MAARLSHKWGIALVALAVAAGLIPAASANGPNGDPMVALFNPNTAEWNLRYDNGYEQTFTFGSPGYISILGDWDCDGVRTVGVYNPKSGKVAVRNSNDAGEPDEQYFYGIPGDTPVAGDWNGDGCDSVGVYRGSESMFYVTNEMKTQQADYRFYFGSKGDIPFAGDFDGDGVDSLGVYRSTSAKVYMRDSLSTGLADRQFSYGIPGDHIFAGDWNNDGVDTVGAFRPAEGKLYLSNVNETSAAALELEYGDHSWVPSSTPKKAPQKAPAPQAISNETPAAERTDTPWIITWGTSQEQHADGTLLKSGATLPASAFFYLVAPDGKSAPAGVDSVHWRTNLDGGYQDDGYPWRWVITGAPTGTHWIEATVNGETKLRAVFQVGNSASPATTESPAKEDNTGQESPSQVAPPASIAAVTPTDGTIRVGPGFHSTTLNARGAGANYQIAIPWTAPRDGAVTAFATYWTHGPEGSYYKGDGGINIVTLRPDANGEPGDSVIGELRIERPCGANGAFVPCGGWGHAHTLDFLSLGTPGNVKAGERYWWHVVNVHPDPSNNWAGIDALSNATGPYDDYPQLYINNGSGWRPASNAHIGKQPINHAHWPDGYIDYRGSTFAPIYAVRYSDGTISSQSPYAEASAALAQWGGSTPIFQQVVVPAGELVNVWLHAQHLSGSDQITLRIGNQTFTQSGSGWLKFDTNLSVAEGTLTLEFSSPGAWRTRGQWRYWDPPESRGGAHHGAIGAKWEVWGARQNADLPFVATIAP